MCPAAPALCRLACQRQGPACLVMNRHDPINTTNVRVFGARAKAGRNRPSSAHQPKSAPGRDDTWYRDPLVIITSHIQKCAPLHGLITVGRCGAPTTVVLEGCHPSANKTSTPLGLEGYADQHLQQRTVENQGTSSQHSTCSTNNPYSQGGGTSRNGSQVRSGSSVL